MCVQHGMAAPSLKSVWPRLKASNVAVVFCEAMRHYCFPVTYNL